LQPSPVFQISGETYRLISAFWSCSAFPRCRKAVTYASPLISDLACPTVHYVDGKHYLADGRWRDWTVERTREELRSLKHQRRGDTCVIVGNGPSLGRNDLSLLDGHDVFIANYAAKDCELRSKARYLSVANPHVAEQEPALFNELKGVVKFFPHWLRYCLNEDGNTFFLNELCGEPFFSLDVGQNISGHSTVTHFNLQIAFTLGYTKVLLIGCDNAYTQPRDAREGDILSCDTDDPNHFRADYFKGKRWQAADTSRMNLVYELVKSAYGKAGREVVNCTVGGRLEVFRRGDLAEELKLQPETPKVAPSLNYMEVDAQVALSYDTMNWLKGRHANEACYLVFDAPPLDIEATLTLGNIVISVDQKDLGVETLSVYPRYLFMTNPTLMMNLAPDIRLLRCTKLLLEPPACLPLKENALTHFAPLNLLTEAVGATPETKCSKQILALGLAAHLGFRTISLPSTVKDELPISVVNHLSRGGITLSFV
jgi:hypothetical protein